MYDSDNDFFDYNLYNSESCLSKDDNISNAGGQFLEPELHWLTDAESELLGSSHNSSSLGRINVAVLEPIDYSTSTVWLKDLIGSSHFIPQCPDNVPNLNCGNFSPEDEDFDAVMHDVPREAAPPSRPGKRLVLPTRNRTVASSRNICAASIKGGVFMDETRGEPFVKKSKGGRRKTLNSTSSIASGSANLSLPTGMPVVSLSPVASPYFSSSDSPATNTSSPPPKVVATKKRKLEKITASEKKSATDTSPRWEIIDRDKPYSRQQIGNRPPRFRCDLCHELNEEHITRSVGDMSRHFLSLKHNEKSYPCRHFRCNKVYTRSDAEKRHEKRCKYKPKAKAPCNMDFFSS